MKKILLLVFTLNFSLFTLHCFSQPAIQWENSFGGTSDDQASSIIQTNDGGYIIAGSAGSNNGDVTDFHGVSTNAWIVKLDSYGVIEWKKCYGGTGGDHANSIVQTSDSGYIFVGHTGSNDGDVSGNHGIWDCWVVKLNDTGAIQWSKCYGGSGSDYGISIVQTVDGGYIFSGETDSNNGDITGNHGSIDAWVVKLNNTGTIQWSKCYGGSLGDGAISIKQTADGGYIFTGGAVSTDGDITGHIGTLQNEWVVKIDTLGNIQWQKSYGGISGGTVAYSILQTSDGGYITGGVTNANDSDVSGNHGGSDYWVEKLTDTGDIQWQKCYGGSSQDIGYSIVKTVDGNYAIGGYSSSTDGQVTGNHNAEDYWVVKLDNNGTLLWEKSYGSAGSDQAYSMIATNDNGFALAGASNWNGGDVTGHHGPNGGYTDYWVVKLAPDSMVGINEIANKGNIVVYPNPVSATLTIRNYELGIRNGELGITDVFGREVYKTTLNGDNNSIDVSGFSNGVYFYQITNNKETLRGKFVKTN